MNVSFRALAILLLALGDLSAAPRRLFVGTYTGRVGEGIYTLTFDASTGAFSPATLAAKAKDPGFLVLDPGKRFLCTGDGIKGGLSSFGVDWSTGNLTLLSQDPGVPGGMISHLAVTAGGRLLLVAGNTPVAAYVYGYPLASDGRLGARSALREQKGPPGPHLPAQAHPHAHCVTLSPDGRFAVVCDRGVDRIFVYGLDPARGALLPGAPRTITPPFGSGPRHGKFSPDGRFFYAASELDGTVCAYAYGAADGTLVLRQTVSTLPEDFAGKNAPAELEITPDGRFLYASNRGPDIVAVFAVERSTGKLTAVERVPCGGKDPRFFTLAPGGRWLLCGNQDSDTITLFRIDPASGRLSAAGSVAVPSPTCIVFD